MAIWRVWRLNWKMYVRWRRRLTKRWSDGLEREMNEGDTSWREGSLIVEDSTKWR